MKTLERKVELNPFDNQKSQNEPEKEAKVEFENDELVEKTLKQYRTLKNELSWIKKEKQIKKQKLETLKPAQINNLLLQIIRETPKQKTEDEQTGLFLSKLIQKSYQAGNNDFILNTQDLQIHCLGKKLVGKKERPIQITIQGNTGDSCGYESKNSIFNIKGNTGLTCGGESKNSTYNIEGKTKGWFGCKSKNSYFNLQGDTGENCGAESKNSTYNIMGNATTDLGKDSKHCRFDVKGNTASWCGESSIKNTFNIGGNTGFRCGMYSEKSTFNIEGNVEDHCGYLSKDCTFTTPNKQTYERMKEDVTQKGWFGVLIKNKVIYTGK